MQVGNDGEATDDLWDQAEALEVTCIDKAHQLFLFVLGELCSWAVVAHDTRIETVGDLALNAIECSCADEENLLGVDLDHLLIGVLASALRGDVHD